MPTWLCHAELQYVDGFGFPARQGQQRSLVRIFHTLSWAFALSPERSLAWGLLASFCGSGASGFIVTDTGAYAEHVAGGYVFTDEETVSSLLRLVNSHSLRDYRASESLRMIEGMAEAWTGGSPVIQTPTAATA